MLSGQKATHAKMNVAEMIMFCWMWGHTRNYRINKDIRSKVGVATTEDKMRETRLRWFRHVNQRPIDAPMRICDYETKAHDKNGRDRPRKTLKDIVRKYMEYLELMKGLRKTVHDSILE